MPAAVLGRVCIARNPYRPLPVVSAPATGASPWTKVA